MSKTVIGRGAAVTLPELIEDRIGGGIQVSRYTYSDAGLNNAALDIYTAINTWIDGLILAGKLTETEGNLISRGDVARLNGEVLKAIKAHSYSDSDRR